MIKRILRKFVKPPNRTPVFNYWENISVDNWVGMDVMINDSKRTLSQRFKEWLYS